MARKDKGTAMDSEISHETVPTIEVRRPRFIVAGGSGNRGKSLFLRWMILRARAAGRVVDIADFDRKDAGLTAFFGRPRLDESGQVIYDHESGAPIIDGVIRPRFSDDESVRQGLSDVTDACRTVAVDMGGGDTVFPAFARNFQLVDMLTGAGVIPVSINLISPDPSDLAALEELESDGTFQPEHTLLVPNAGLTMDQRPFGLVFRDVLTHPTYLAAKARGAREIVMPRLPCMADVDRAGLSFEEAAARPGKASPLGLTRGTMVTLWLREMEKRFSPAEECLA